LLQLGQLLLDGGKTCLVGTLQFSPAEHEVAQRVLARLGLLGREVGWVERLVERVEALVATHAGPEGGHGAKHGVVGSAQLGRVGHGVEVAHGAPGAA